MALDGEPITSEENVSMTSEPITGTSPMVPHDFDNFNPAPVTAVFSLLCLLIVLVNISILLTLLTSRNRKLWTPTNILIGNLAVLDLLVGLCSAPPMVVQLYYLVLGFHGCVAVFVLAMTVNTISLIFAALIAVERYICVKFPYTKDALLTDRNICGTLVVCWFYGILLCSLPQLGWNIGASDDYFCAFHKVIDYDFMTFIHAMIHYPSIAVIVFCYTNIFMVARRHARQINDVTVAENADTTKKMKLMKAELKLSWKCFIFVVLYIFTRFPNVVLNLVEYLGGPKCLACRVTLVWFAVLNSLLNPILYANSSKDLKTAIKLNANLVLPVRIQFEVSGDSDS